MDFKFSGYENPFGLNVVIKTLPGFENSDFLTKKPFLRSFKQPYHSIGIMIEGYIDYSFFLLLCNGKFIDFRQLDTKEIFFKGLNPRLYVFTRFHISTIQYFEITNDLIPFFKRFEIGFCMNKVTFFLKDTKDSFPVLIDQDFFKYYDNPIQLNNHYGFICSNYREFAEVYYKTKLSFDIDIEKSYSLMLCIVDYGLAKYNLREYVNYIIENNKGVDFFITSIEDISNKLAKADSMNDIDIISCLNTGILLVEVEIDLQKIKRYYNEHSISYTLYSDENAIWNKLMLNSINMKLHYCPK
jgi:hypothetical protein